MAKGLSMDSGQQMERPLAPEEKKKRIAQLRAELKKLQAVPRSDWHMGFEALLRIDTHKYGKRVRIEPEHVLGEEPPRADYLILKGDGGLRLEKEIFQIFRRHNIIEYKSPHTSLNERVLRKICGYANYYIGVAGHEGDVPAEQVTISIFRAVKNPGLFREMEDKGNLVKTKTVGIYRVEGMTDLPFQIVVTGELEGSEYAAYRALTDRADMGDVGQVIEDSRREMDDTMKGYYHVLVELVAKKNPEAIENIRRERGMSSALMEIMKEEVAEVVSQAETAKEQETKASDIKSLMINFGWNEEQAMDALSIPQSQRAVYAELVSKMGVFQS